MRPELSLAIQAGRAPAQTVETGMAHLDFRCVIRPDTEKSVDPPPAHPA